ncbi:MAG: methionyl-tRNA formyltransferase [Treponema sp.]|nr:methionyl-tRNA formyltransferase [Treponema sp.]
MNIVYAGSPLASRFVLKNLISAQSECNFKIVGVLTNPPSTRGRHSDLIPTEVAQTARENNIPVFEFEHLLAEAREAISLLGADLLVSFDYGRIFGAKFLSLFPLGGINLHPSALPKYRGCTPVPAAILNGDASIGITVQKLALKMDEGDILAQENVPLTGSETTSSLMDGDGNTSLVTEIGAKMLKMVLKSAAESDSELTGKKQSGEASYTPFLKKEDGIIDWNCTAAQIERKIRAYTPFPLCSTTFDGLRLTILKAKPSDSKTSETPGTVLPYQKSVGIEIACGEGSVLVVTELQLEKKKAMDYKSFINGARNFVGSVLVS